jgi:molybdopterin-binding protein
MEALLRIGEVAKAVGVSVDTLRRWETNGRVSFVRRGNQRLLRASDLGPLIDAHGGGRPVLSARNRLNGVVLAVEINGVMAKVDMACGKYRVTSLMSREAAEELGLAPGVDATAIIKSTNVMIEDPVAPADTRPRRAKEPGSAAPD